MTTLPSGSDRLARPSIFARRPVATGVAVGALSLLPHVYLLPHVSLAFAAVVIALIAGVYFGFAVVNGSPGQVLVELAVAAIFTLSGLFGLLYWPLLLAGAYFAHAAWDLAHHHRARLPLVPIPRWYVPWCVIIDVIVGGGLLVLWRGAGTL